jgi:hypothetical protein
VSCPPGTTCKSWGSLVVRGSATTESSGHSPLVLCLGSRVRVGLAVRAEFHAKPPPCVERWLDEHGIEI